MTTSAGSMSRASKTSWGNSEMSNHRLLLLSLLSLSLLLLLVVVVGVLPLMLIVGEVAVERLRAILSDAGEYGCRITSWMCWYSLAMSAMSERVCTRSSWLSPMPINIPVVKGIRNLPA